MDIIPLLVICILVHVYVSVCIHRLFTSGLLQLKYSSTAPIEDTLQP